MTDTNFTALTTEDKKVWSREIWSIARNNSFAFQFMGSDENSMIQRITELTRTERGDEAVMTLVPDLEDDGTVGDTELEGQEEGIKAYDEVITIDQLRHANRSAGAMSEQRSIVNFRKTSRNVLGYWLADRIDQMCFLSLSGVPYTHKNSGALRPVNAGHNLDDLAFGNGVDQAGNGVTSPSSDRHFRWDDATGTLLAGDTTLVSPADTPTYNMLVLAKAEAKEMYIKGLRSKGGQEMYHVFMSPTGMAKLKMDADFRNNLLHAWNRSDKNPLFAGTSAVMADGLIIHEYRHVFNTRKATDLTGAGDNGDPGFKWGTYAEDAAGVLGQRVLLCGAQALGFCDLGAPKWVEKWFDYDNKPGIATGKIMGILKPRFYSPDSGDTQDFGVMCIDTAI